MNSSEEVDKTSELWRAKCEAREWLRRGYTTKVKVEEPMVRIMKIRGKEAAEKLREDMRIEYKNNKRAGKNG